MPQLKSWESPRRQGRNHKGRGGSARARQLKKRQQTLRKKLKSNPNHQPGKSQNTAFPVFLGILPGDRLQGREHCSYNRCRPTALTP
jgi:hypothetical protein